jgi:phage regulator Rha-like protein
MNRTQKEYLLTRDGFSLVVMGFTGQKALQWKLKYIEAFNKMEAQLKGNTQIALSLQLVNFISGQNVEHGTLEIQPTYY